MIPHSITAGREIDDPFFSGARGAGWVWVFFLVPFIRNLNPVFFFCRQGRVCRTQQICENRNVEQEQ